MRAKTFGVSSCFSIAVGLVVGLFGLTGCASAISDVKSTAVPTPVPTVKTRQLQAAVARTTPNTIAPIPHLSSPTSLPPTRRSMKPTASLTPAPVPNSPTPEQHFAPVRLIIPVIDLDVPVIPMGWSVVDHGGQPVSEWDVPDWRAAGWLKTSALVGEQGNTVLEGHQDIDGRVFENLDQLKEGDEIQLQASTETHKYVVALRTIVPEKDQPPEVQRDNARWIGHSNDERLTLVTCWPRNDNTHRLILVALPKR